MVTILDFLARDHQRLDSLLQDLLHNGIDDTSFVIDSESYRKLRAGLLLHIRFEEIVLFPAMRKSNDPREVELASKLRLDHGAIASLLVPFPTFRILHALQTVLETHNKLEEGTAGAYAQCDELIGGDAERLIGEFENMPPVPMAKNTDIPLALVAAGRALERAGFSRSLIIS